MQLRGIILLVAATLFTLKITAQTEETVVSGDLYFQIWRDKSTYGLGDTLRDKVVAAYEKDLKRSRKKRLYTEKDLSRYTLLKAKGLIDAPYVELIDSAAVKTVYLDQASYDRIRAYRYHDLVAAGEKLYLEITASLIAENTYGGTAVRILRTEPGTTLPRETKFAVIDYP